MQIIMPFRNKCFNYKNCGNYAKGSVNPISTIGLTKNKLILDSCEDCKELAHKRVTEWADRVLDERNEKLKKLEEGLND